MLSPHIDRLTVYPVIEYFFRRQPFVYHPSASLNILDGFNPAIVDMRITLAVGELLLIVVHRTAKTADSAVALIVQFAMLNAEGVQKEPYLIVGPLDDWRDKERFIASDAADGTLVTDIGDVYLMNATLGWPAALLAVPLVTELIKTFKGAAVLMVGNLDLTPTRTLSAFCVADAYKNHVACTDTFFIDSATPSYQPCREHTFFSSLIVDTDFRLYHIYVRILLATKLNYFRRINGR